jgi:signal recognition particle receptor subunit beta
MSFINYSAREINCKLVYYGPGLCGKTTNLQFIYSKTRPESKGKMISLATETERTLFFDFLPLSLGEIRGFKTRFHLYTVPGQVFYDASRKLILKGVDGVCFVADSQLERMEANIESLDNLRFNLEEQGYDLDKLPYVIQYNKRDLPSAVPLDELRATLNTNNVPDFEASAVTGEGVSCPTRSTAGRRSPSRGKRRSWASRSCSVTRTCTAASGPCGRAC